MRKLVVAGLTLAVAACGSGGPSTTAVTVAGSIAGRSFGAKEAVFNLGMWSNGFGQFLGTTTAIQISDYADQCILDAKGQQPPGTQNLVLVLSENDGQGLASPVTAPGDFPIEASDADASARGARRADAWWEAGNGSAPSGSFGCFRGQSASAAPGGGHVTVTAVTPDRIEGTFDVTLEKGDHVTGSFGAARCGATCTPGAACVGLDLNVSLRCP